MSKCLILLLHWFAKASLGRVWSKPGLGTLKQLSAILLTAMSLCDLDVKEMKRKTGRVVLLSVCQSSSLKGELQFIPTFSSGYLTYFEPKCFKCYCFCTFVKLTQLNCISQQYNNTANIVIKCTIIVRIKLGCDLAILCWRRHFLMDLLYSFSVIHCPYLGARCHGDFFPLRRLQFAIFF